MWRSASVSAERRSAGSTVSAQAPSAAARSARVLVTGSTTLPRTWGVLAWRGSPLSLLIVDDADLERFRTAGWSDVHRDVRVIGLERLPVVAECVEHVVVADTVLAGARLDVDHFGTVPTTLRFVNTC